ncbi:hypothetical protein L1887_01007 [Cichorium endivia]|nr:hypothetical protein L1887_01007 [Cichorium endivia]
MPYIRSQIQVFILQHRVFSFPPPRCFIFAVAPSHQPTAQQPSSKPHRQSTTTVVGSSSSSPPVGICLVDQHRPLPDFLFDKTSDAVRSSAKLTSTSIEIIEKEENVVIDEFNRSAPIDETPENKSNFEFFLKRDTFTQLLALFFFGKIDDRYSLLKIFVKAKFMPFSISTPWGKVMADPRKNRKETVKEGYHLLSLMLHPAINLKCYEAIVCGPFARGLLARTFGDLIAMAFQSFMEVYFMVAWMMYYLSVKSVDANSHGQPFGQRELEAMLEDVR